MHKAFAAGDMSIRTLNRKGLQNSLRIFVGRSKFTFKLHYCHHTQTRSRERPKWEFPKIGDPNMVP